MKKEKSFIEYLKALPLGTRLAACVAVLAVLFAQGISPETAKNIALGVGGENTSDPDVSDETAELAEVCSMVEGVGRCRVMINYTESGEVGAVAVLCDGADRTEVRSRLVGLISSLYGIGTHRISVLKISADGNISE